MSLAALESETGLHANTVRGHLDALGREGFVIRRRRSPTARGRPPWLYGPVDQQPLLGVREYGGLTGALASALARTGEVADEAAFEAGRSWGGQLARSQPPGDPARSPRERVIVMLRAYGFAPRPTTGDVTVRLTRCPLLETARAHPEVVCSVHLGIVHAALEEFGSSSDGVALHPFAEPGACRLDLPLTAERRAVQ